MTITRATRRVSPTPTPAAFTGLALAAVVCIFGTTAAAQTSVGIISTIAGTGTQGYSGDGSAGNAARVNNPSGTAVDSQGNVYIADRTNHRIRKVSATTGVITTVAGTGTPGFSGDGASAVSARLWFPYGVAVDGAGNLYIADSNNNRIRKVTAAGIISTVTGDGTPGFAGDGGPATSARLSDPSAVAVSASGDLYIVDRANQRIRKVTLATNIITTLAGSGTAGYNGDGVATAAHLNYPSGVAVDASGNVYIGDEANNRIRRVNQATGQLTTVAGTGVGGYSNEGGTATSSQIYWPKGVAVDGSGDVYIADYARYRVRKLVVATGRLYTVAGSATSAFGGDGGLATAAQLEYPSGVAVDGTGALYIADYWNHRVRKVSAPTPTLMLHTIAGDGTDGYSGDGTAAINARLHYPYAAVADTAGNVYIADANNNRVRKVTPEGVISTYAGTGVQGNNGDGAAATSAAIYSPRALVVDGANNLYILTFNSRIRRVSAATGIITTIAGNGSGGDGSPAVTAQLNAPAGIALDAAGNIYIADTYSQRIRRISAATGIISTIAGNGSAGFSGDGGAATGAQLRYPEGVAVDGSGNVYVGDTWNDRIRKIDASGTITTVAGGGSSYGENGAGTAAALDGPTGVAVDGAGNVYFGVLGFDQRIRKLTVATSILTTVAGSGDAFGGGDGVVATTAGLHGPRSVSLDAAGNLYIADTNNHRVRRVGLPPAPPSNLTLQRYGPTGVILNWTAAPGATSYIVKRGTSPGTMTPYAGGIASTSAYITGTKNTRYVFTVSAVFSGVESANANTVAISLTTNAGRGDLDGDGASDLLLYRAASGNWFSRNSASNYTIGAGTWNLQWGTPGDVPMSGDFDADGRIDPTVFRPSTGQWFILYSSTGYNPAQYGYLEWGAGGDVPFAADFDGDGYCDIGIFRPASGYWYLRLSSQGWTPGAGASTFAWGAAGDVPITGDLDGDGKADIGVFRPTTGQWFFLYSSINYNAAQYGYFEWGASGDINLTADFDGDARGDIGVYRPSTGQWFLLLSSLGYNPAQYGYFAWGAAGDEPKMGDFDGDSRGDVAVYRPSGGNWFILYSSKLWDPAQAGSYQWGATGDIALPTN